MRLPRELDPIEIRVLGCLLEKERTTPDGYPLSLNALKSACNQKSNRDPVMELTGPEVESVLARLRSEVLVWPEEGARTQKWTHNLDRKWALSPASMALMTVLMLRGPLVVHLARQPGQKEARWTHLVGGEPDVATSVFVPSASPPPASGLTERIAELEERVARLEVALGVGDDGL